MSNESDKDFFDYASDLIGEQVQVITVEGSYYGELKALKSDFLLLLTTNRGQTSIIAIRFKKIIGISRNLYKERRRPLFFGQQWNQEQDHTDDQYDDHVEDHYEHSADNDHDEHENHDFHDEK
ncbi:hypothetical protein F7984_08440 [Pradoshia sp. D12]|uniref:hypothetical protein n=1 Tax=Bacillaceae TaxID=186817 RepID=UPI0011260DF3|nr:MULTISPECIES: hypothetical protein [Bacillaceae]QFK71271.1 hypothetical protein F7984_08440 [Pradoshia sp. D12]TPF73064.1 hypothetical protein FHY44_04830 [Bacillus sp. D12]